MATLFYGVMGEGRGHATRVRALVEDLRHHHQVSIFSSAQGLEMLQDFYEGTTVKVHRIPGLNFAYDLHHRVDYVRSLYQAWRFGRQLNRYVDALMAHFQEAKPDLVITDFEPLLPRAARRAGIPFLSLNHQHIIMAHELRALPRSLRVKVALMRPFVRLFYTGQVRTIMSSFYVAPLRPSYRDALQVGVMLRPELIRAQDRWRGQQGAHLVAYFRRFASPRILDTLRQSEREIRVYGLGSQADDGNLRFRPICESGFIEDLATSQALITTAGNQVIGEAHFLRKPVLALPERSNFEQAINAYYLRKSRGGNWVSMAQFAPSTLQHFLERLGFYRDHIDADRIYGNLPALRAIESYLHRDQRACVPSKPFFTTGASFK